MLIFKINVMIHIVLENKVREMVAFQVKNIYVYAV